MLCHKGRNPASRKSPLSDLICSRTGGPRHARPNMGRASALRYGDVQAFAKPTNDGHPMKDQYTFMLALWGTLVSTFLASIKIWEISRERLRLTTSYSFSTSPEHGNQVMIQNTSKTPALITYWELMWANRHFGWTFFDRMAAAYSEMGHCNIIVAAHSIYTLEFFGAEHFKTQDKIEGHTVELYLRVYLAGRESAIWLPVWTAGGRISLVERLRRKVRNMWRRKQPQQRR